MDYGLWRNIYPFVPRWKLSQNPIVLRRKLDQNPLLGRKLDKNLQAIVLDQNTWSFVLRLLLDQNH